jgi:hypothetical protein
VLPYPIVRSLSSFSIIILHAGFPVSVNIVKKPGSGILESDLESLKVGSGAVVKCAKCGYENPIGELICIQCDTLLVPGQQNDVPEGATRELEVGDELANFPRWGTARLGRERKLLLHIRGYDQPVVVSLSDEIILGRYDTTTGEIPDVDLADYGAEENGVSRRHAAVIVEDDALKVLDLGSANATYINGQKLIAHQARILRDGDELRLGHLVIRVHFA